MEKEGTIKLNANEAAKLATLLHYANLHKGLEVAEICLYFKKKIEQSFKLQPTKELEETHNKNGQTKI